MESASCPYTAVTFHRGTTDAPGEQVGDKILIPPERPWSYTLTVTDGGMIHAAGDEPAEIVREWPDGLAIVPINPVTDGHVLVIPRAHVRDAVENKAITALWNEPQNSPPATQRQTS